MEFVSSNKSSMWGMVLVMEELLAKDNTMIEEQLV